MAVDPNWIFSTAAQSAAALVGIVGAFLVSALLSIGNEHARVAARLRDVNDRLTHLQAKREELWDDMEEIEARAFLAQIVDTLNEHRANLDLAPARRLAATELADEKLRPYFDAFKEQMRRAFQFFRENRFDRDQRPPQSMEEFLFTRALDLPGGADADAYRQVYHQLQKEWKQPARSGVLGMATGGLDFHEISKMLPAPDFFEGWSEYNTKNEEARKLGAEIDLLSVDQRALETDTRAGGDLAHIWTGFWILVYFAMVGIVIPLSIMPVEPGALPTWLRWLNVALFGSGLLALAAYLAYLIARIKRNVEAGRANR